MDHPMDGEAALAGLGEEGSGAEGGLVVTRIGLGVAGLQN